jgi:tRNA nucleotidyltransferase (CCA-adding enzyme)
MLHFDALRGLEKHFDSLDTLLKPGSYYIVWWACRDLLLGHEINPTDIDLTWPGTPETIWALLQKKASGDLFRTEKFGTMTLITEWITYEFTPFRTEGTYADFRHPKEVTRTDDLLADSNRRDLTINARYTSRVSLPWIPWWDHTPIDIPFSALDELWQTNTTRYLPEHHLLYAWSTEIIATLMDQWVICADRVKTLLDTIPHITIQTTETTIPSTQSAFSDHKDHKTSNLTQPLLIILDPHHGIRDLLTHTIKAVWDPYQRFSEDALRILRAVRFVNKLNNRLNDEDTGYDFDNTTRLAMKKCYYLVSYIAKERIKEEITKVFSDTNPMWYVALLEELNLLKIIFPALAQTKNVAQPVRYHSFDVYAHTLLTLHALQWLTNDYLARLAMAYHDVGKTDQYYYFSQHISKEEKRLPITHHMYHAQSLSPELAKQDFSALWFSKKEVETICTYITYHHRPWEILDSPPEKRMKKLRSLLSTLWYETFSMIIRLAIADRLWQHNPMQPPQLTKLYALQDEFTQLYEKEGRFTMHNLAISGNDIMTTFSLIPWPHIGKLLELAFQRVMNDIQARNNQETIINYLAWLQELQELKKQGSQDQRAKTHE